MILVTQVAVCTKLRGSELALPLVTEDDLAMMVLKRLLLVCVYTNCFLLSFSCGKYVPGYNQGCYHSSRQLHASRGEYF